MEINNRFEHLFPFPFVASWISKSIFRLTILLDSQMYVVWMLSAPPPLSLPLPLFSLSLFPCLLLKLNVYHERCTQKGCTHRLLVWWDVGCSDRRHTVFYIVHTHRIWFWWLCVCIVLAFCCCFCCVNLPFHTSSICSLSSSLKNWLKCRKNTTSDYNFYRCRANSKFCLRLDSRK